MAQSWYYLDGEKQVGPIPLATLKELVSQGVIREETLVHLEGTSDWRMAKSVGGLIPAPTSPSQIRVAPPPLPPSVPAPPENQIPSQTSTSPVSSTRSRKPTGIIVMSTVCGMLVIALIAFFALKERPTDRLNSDGRTGHSDSNPPVNPDTSGPQVVDQEELERLEEKKAKLIDEIRELEKSRQELNEKKLHLEGDIENLVSRYEEFQKWQKLDFALVSDSGFAAGFQDRGEQGLFLVSKLSGEDGTFASQIIRSARGVRIDKDDDLTQQTYLKGEVGKAIPDEIERSIRKYWRSYPFFEAPVDEETKYIALYDYDVNRRNIGVFRSVDFDGIQYEQLGRGVVNIPKTRIQPGSARVAPRDRLLNTLSEEDFLDYCILNVAHEIHSRQFETSSNDGRLSPGYVNIAVHCEVDIPRERMRHYRSIDSMLADHAGDRLINYVRRASGNSSFSLGRIGNVGFGGGQSSYVDNENYVNRPIVFDVLEKREKLYDEMMEPQLQEACESLEDEIYRKLYDAKVPTVENELATDSAFLDGSDDPVEMALRNNATHLLRVQLKRPSSSGQYSLTTRLLDVRTKEHLWSGFGDRAYDTTLIGQQYHVKTGRLAMVEVNENDFENFVGMETPRVMETYGVPYGSKNSHLVYVEQTPENGNPLNFRTLFDTRIRTAPDETITRVTWIDDEESVPRHLRLRYVVCRLLTAMLPSSGRVVEVDGRNGVALLGRRDGIREAEELMVLRVRQSQRDDVPVSTRDQGVTAESYSLIPQEIVVTEVFDDHCRIYINDNGLESWFPENAVLQVGDIVARKPSHSVVIGVTQPELAKEPPGLIASFRQPGIEVRLRQDAESTGREVNRLIRNSLRMMNVPVIFAEDEQVVAQVGCTHFVHTSLTLSEAMKGPGHPIYKFGFVVRENRKERRFGDQFNVELRMDDIFDR